MAKIQQVAMELFDRDGYDNVTVERVAADAGVSPSSVYRYFGTKEKLVLHDEYDPEILRLLETAGEGDIVEPQALLAVARAVTPVLIETMLGPAAEARIRRRLHFVRTVPALKDAMTQQNRELEESLRKVLGNRTGRTADDLDIWMVAAAAAWICFAALNHWAEQGYPGPLKDVYAKAIDSIVGYAENVFGSR